MPVAEVSDEGSHSEGSRSPCESRSRSPSSRSSPPRPTPRASTADQVPVQGKGKGKGKGKSSKSGEIQTILRDFLEHSDRQLRPEAGTPLVSKMPMKFNIKFGGFIIY